MHAASIDRSARLNRVLGLLADYGWHGTRDIVHAADVCAVNSIAAEIRANGIGVECRCVGRGRFEYRLEPRRVPVEQMPLIVCTAFMGIHKSHA